MAYPIQIGNNSARVISTRRVYDPARGPRAEITFEGSEDALNVLAANFMIAGAKADVQQHNGPVHRMIVLFGDAQDGSAEVPLDKWEIDTEWAEISIWSNPKVIFNAGSAQTLSKWRTEIDAALLAGKTLSASGFAGMQASIYAEVLYGTRATEVKRPVLSRVRTISSFYADQIIVDAVEFIYTTETLIAAFGIPASVASRLPLGDNSILPPNRLYGWKERKQTSEFIPAINKTEEVRDWIFAPWSVLFYNFT